MKISSKILIFLQLSTSCNAFANVPKTFQKPTTLCMSSTLDETTSDRRSFLTQSSTSTAAIIGAAAGLSSNSQVASAASQMWQQVKVPFEDTIYDIDFDTAEHGYLVGARGSFAETNDGGKTWEARSFQNLDAEEEVNYRFTEVSFSGGEGWVLGKPALMLHSKDAGKTWERIPLSPKLPGDPTSITCLGPNSAEMTTSTGAIYVTENAGRNWKAQVKETIDATLNRVSSSGVSGASYFTGAIVNQARDDTGAYLAVSSRGNFFLTWEPEQDFWIPHNRGTSRRIQNMGFVEGDIKKGVWMTLNGGKLLIKKGDVDLNQDTLDFKESNIKTGGYGITDVAWRNENEVWAVGGSNTMYVSFDGGNTFAFDKSANNIPGNLYNVKFFKQFDNTGWALGSNGLLLKYVG